MNLKIPTFMGISDRVQPDKNKNPPTKKKPIIDSLKMLSTFHRSLFRFQLNSILGNDHIMIWCLEVNILHQYQ